MSLSDLNARHLPWIAALPFPPSPARFIYSTTVLYCIDDPTTKAYQSGKNLAEPTEYS